MEAILLVIDAFVVIGIVWFSLANDRRRPDEPQTGLFRILLPRKPEPAQTQRRR